MTSQIFVAHWVPRQLRGIFGSDEFGVMLQEESFSPLQSRLGV